MVRNVDADFVDEQMVKLVPVINVLPPAEFDGKRIPGSFNAPADSPGFDEAVQSFAPDKQRPVIVHGADAASPESVKAAKRLEALGYAQVFDYKAGIVDWERSGRTLQSNHAMRRPVRPEAGQARERLGAQRATNAEPNTPM